MPPARRSLIALSCLVAGLLAGAPPAPAASAPSAVSSAFDAASPGPALASAAGSSGSTKSTASAAEQSNSEQPIPVSASNTPPAGRRLSANAVLAIADRLSKMRAVRRRYPGSFGDAYLLGPLRWQVSYFSRNGKSEIGQVIIDDRSGRVLEQWTGFQVAWTMARGYPGAFGRHVDALYVWLPLCVLFVVPFLNWRRPFCLLHLDLLVLLAFSISLAFFNHGRIYASVPLAYPPLVYLLARMLWLARPANRRRDAGPLRLLVPASWLAVAVVFLIGFRIALNVVDSNVIDVGYAGVIGAERITHDGRLYGAYPSNNEHGDTYGPVNYEAYVPFVEIFGWSGKWDDLPAAHGAAIFFDLLAVGMVFLLGRRVRGPTLGIALAYAWVSYPFTLFALESNANDTLVAVLVLGALLVASSPPARGVFAALAGLTKFAPLLLAPLLATYDLPERRWGRALAAFLLAFALTVAVVSIPALTHDSLNTIFQRTIVYQGHRDSPFSVWGLYGGLAGVEVGVEIAAVALVLGLALFPFGRDLIGLAAACAAVMIAIQLGIEHWFYLYIPWFFALAMLALLGRFSEPSISAPAAASGSARSSRPALVASSG